MADKRDFYEVLGVDKNATQKQIKDAYRRLARKLHPDVNPDPSAADQFKEVGEAYSILSDDDKRAQFDRFGHAAFQPSAGPGAGGFPGGVSFDVEDLFGGGGAGRGGGMGGFGDIFEDLFGAAVGGARHSRMARKGADLQFVIDLTLEDVASGIKKDLRYRRHVTCPTCHGSGGAPNTQPMDCPDCRGQGWIGQSRGFMTVRQACRRCKGTGQVNSSDCPDCRGRGIIEKEETLPVDIPQGVDTNSRVRYEGKGEAGINGGPSGDLFIIARVKEHDFFVRKGDNLYCEVPITVYEAVLGAKIRVPTLRDEATVTIPPGVSTGETVIIKGKGIPHLRGWGTGDQVILLNVVNPSTLNRQQKKLFQQLQDLDKSDIRKHLKVSAG